MQEHRFEQLRVVRSGAVIVDGKPSLCVWMPDGRAIALQAATDAVLSGLIRHAREVGQLARPDTTPT